jgi:hypothetical protein
LRTLGVAELETEKRQLRELLAQARLELRQKLGLK